jgi:micrococcal nuclease
MKKLYWLLIIILITNFSLLLYYKITGSVIVKEVRTVTKVIDGDTVIISGGRSVRLLGIDSDERGQPCYNQAKQRLESLVLNKKVYLELDKEDKDQYGRLLRYIFLDEQNINVLLVKEGLAIARFQGNEKYSQEITEAEEEAMNKKLGCKWSN